MTLAETGGAQTFVNAIVAGLRDAYDLHVAAHGPEGAVVDACRRLGVPFHHVERMHRDVEPLNDVLAVAELRALGRRLRPDLVQTNSSKAGVLARLAMAGSSARVVHTAHGLAFSGRGGVAGTVYATAERVAAPLSDVVVCVSNYDRRLMAERGVVDPGRMEVIRYGIAVAPDPPPRGPWPANPVLACTARLAAPKDVPQLLDALARPGLEHMRLRVFGDGPDRGAIEARIGSLGLGDRVELTGNLPDVPAQLRACDAFVLPTWWEGLPLSILEGMAAALPVVASDVCGIPEAVVEDVTGHVVPPGDVDALAAALRRLDADGRARELGLRGHARARRHFLLEGMVARYDALFRGVLARGPRPGPLGILRGRGARGGASPVATMDR